MLDQLSKIFTLPSADASWVVLLVATWGASLIGSPHCLGMCGPLASAVSRTFWQNVFYNLGRAVSYILAGFIFGWLGQTILDFSSQPVRYVATGVMVCLVLWVSFRIAINKPFHIQLPSWFYKAHRAILKPSQNPQKYDEVVRSAMAGFFTVGLPCGWLYTFLALAAATGSASRGALTLMAFWLGTLPMMAVAPAVVGRFLLALQNKSPRLAGVMVAASSLFVIWMRWMPVVNHTTSCH